MSVIDTKALLDHLCLQGAVYRVGEAYYVSKDGESAPEPVRVKARAPCQMPDDWEPKPEVYGWAIKQVGPELAKAYLDYFCDYARAKGVKYVDWNLAFRNCVRGDWGQLKQKQGKSASTMQYR